MSEINQGASLGSHQKNNRENEQRNERESEQQNHPQETKNQIEKILTDHKVVLFMKGTPQFPQCGFSQRATLMLQELGVQFHPVNVLEAPEIRQGIKDYGNWPTIPQLYIDKKLIGGSDIMLEMFESGELREVLSSSSPGDWLGGFANNWMELLLPPWSSIELLFQILSPKFYFKRAPLSSPALVTGVFTHGKNQPKWRKMWGHWQTLRKHGPTHLSVPNNYNHLELEWNLLSIKL